MADKDPLDIATDGLVLAAKAFVTQELNFSYARIATLQAKLTEANQKIKVLETALAATKD